MRNFFTFRQNSWFRLQLENMNQGWTKLLSRSAWLFARHYLLTTSCSPSASRLVVTPSTLSWKSWSKALVAKRTSPPVSWEESWGEENKTDWWRDWTSVWKSSHGCEAQMWIMWKRFQFWRRTERTQRQWCVTMQTPSHLKSTCSWIHTIRCAIVRITWHPVHGKNVPQIEKSNNFLWERAPGTGLLASVS